MKGVVAFGSRGIAPLGLQGPAPSAGGPEDRFSSLAAMEVVEGAAPQPIHYHTVTQCDAFRPLSVEQYHWQEYQAQGASLWRHTPAAQHQCAAAAAAMPHSLGASASSSPRSKAGFRSAPEVDGGLAVTGPGPPPKGRALGVPQGPPNGEPPAVCQHSTTLFWGR